MSRSVKSFQSSASRRHTPSKDNRHSEIKLRIKEILYTVKDERQHIENLLHQNDLEIESLKQEYENMRQENDFDNLSPQQNTILRQMAEGLKELAIEPSQVLGHSACLREEEGAKGEEGERGTGEEGERGGQGRRLSKEEIIGVQEVMLVRLQSLLLEQ